MVVRAVAEGNQRDVKGGDDEKHDRAQRQDHNGSVEDPPRDLACPLVLARRQVLRQHRDERRADGAGQQEVEQEVGDAEGDPVVIDLMAGPESIRDHQLAYGAEHPAEAVGDQDERCGRRDAPPLASHRGSF